MVRIVLTARGAEQAIDGDGYIYYFNRKTESVKYWLCSQAGCNVRIITTISTSQLVSDTLPMHEHGTNLNKRKAKEAVASTIKKFATLSSTTAKQALCEITNTLLASENLDSLYAMTSAGSIKSALWREKKKISDMLKLPKTYQELMNMELPTKYTKTADGGDFLLLNCWVDKASIMLFLSDTGVDIQRRAKTWLMDGTFKTVPYAILSGIHN